jgi:hypothetical protein
MIKKKKSKKKPPSAPLNFNKPGFSSSSISSQVAKKKVMLQLERQGISGADKLNAMSRGKLTQSSSTGKFTYSTNAMSSASPSGRDVPLPSSK